jgi:hypothetical protein
VVCPLPECKRSFLTISTGVCVPTSECRSAGGTFKAGHCPGPSDIQCCTKGNCKWVIPNKCPGGADIMHLQYENKCAVVQFGQCPGPSTFVKYVRDY